MKVCKMCGSELPSDAVFCRNCGAACYDETENTAVLDEELVETELSSTDVEETAILEEKVEETATLEMESYSDEDTDTTILAQPENEKETITTVIPYEKASEVSKKNEIDEAESGEISYVNNNKKGIIVAFIVVTLIAVISICVSVSLAIQSNNNNQSSNIQNTYDSQVPSIEIELDPVVLSDVKTGDHISFSLPMTVEEFSKLDGIEISEDLSTIYTPDEDYPDDNLIYLVDVSYNSNNFTIYFSLPLNQECELRRGIIHAIDIDKNSDNSNENLTIFGISLDTTKHQFISQFGDKYSRYCYSEEDGYDVPCYSYSYESDDVTLYVTFPTDNDDAKATAITYSKYE